MDITDSDNLTQRRTKRILKKKGQKGVFKVQKRKAKRKAVVKKVVGATVGNALLAPLLPFKKSMETALNKKGVATDKMNFRTVVAKFFNEFVSKSGNKKSSYDSIDEVEFINDRNFVLPVKELDYSPEDSDNLALTTATISAVVTGIINLFKKAKEKRQAAKDTGLSESEAKEIIPVQDLQFGKDAAEVERKLIEKAKEDQPVTKTGVKKYVVYAAVLLVLGVLVYALGKKK